MDSGRISTNSLYLAGPRTGVHTSVNGCFSKNFAQCLREGCARAVHTLKSGHYSHGPLNSAGYSSSASLVRQWIHVLRQFGCFWTSRLHFYLKGNSDPEVDSRPALRRVASRFGEVCIVDASVSVFARSWCIPLYLTVICSSSD